MGEKRDGYVETDVNRAIQLTVEETRKKMDGSLTLDELKGELHSARDPFMNKVS